MMFSVHRDFLRDITDERDNKCTFRRSVKDKVTVQIRYSAVGCTFQHDTGPNHRLSAFCYDLPFQRNSLHSYLYLTYICKDDDG